MRLGRSTRSLLIAFAGVIVAACASNTVASDTDTGGQTPDKAAGISPPPASSQDADWAAIERLEAQAKALASASGCSSAGECKSAPVGSRGCGGPRYYIPYCPKTTDSAAFYRKLDEVSAAEKAYNAKYQIASTCEMRMPPDLALTGGACAAK